MPARGYVVAAWLVAGLVAAGCTALDGATGREAFEHQLRQLVIPAVADDAGALPERIEAAAAASSSGRARVHLAAMRVSQSSSGVHLVGVVSIVEEGGGQCLAYEVDRRGRVRTAFVDGDVGNGCTDAMPPSDWRPTG